ncbi:uncharacterized protein icam3 [Thalassophryne amazonica]|uniref:uncharacterized protein icam3 n=1 Tax=Thalassophryne amazonica TaxID=390379 RepID=UPI001471E967|nr:uncharacterized protein icam3 [Thalassophryne amazonica]
MCTLSSLRLVGFVLSLTGVHASCPIEMNPKSVAVKYGTSVSVNCSTSSRHDGMGWEAQEGGTGLMMVNHLTWTVGSLKTWTVSPKCYINVLNPNEQCYKDLKVVLYTFPETISIVGVGPMEEGIKYEFTCDIREVAPLHNLSVWWYTPVEIITHNFHNAIKTPVHVSDKLTMTASRNVTGGKLRCEALLDLAPDGPQLKVSSQEYNLTVHYGPEIGCSLVEMAEGETLESACPVLGNPTPVVTWMKNGRPIDPTIPMDRKDVGLYVVEAKGHVSKKKNVSVHVFYGPEVSCPVNYTIVEYSANNFRCFIQGHPKPIVIIYKDDDEVYLPKTLTRNDAGQYLIAVSNAHSSVNFTFEINVEYPPSKIAELEDSEVEAGSAVWLKCSSTGNPRPNYSWEYYKTANVIEKNEDGVSLLQIYNATAANIGFYTCYAENNRGRTSETVRVTVQGKATYYQLIPQYCHRLADKIKVSRLARPMQLKVGKKRGSSCWKNLRDFIPMEDLKSRRLLPLFFTLQLLSLSNGSNSSVKEECPLEIIPDGVVVPYEGRNVTCKPTSSEHGNVKNLHWEASDGTRINSSTFLVEPSRDWDIKPVCIAVFEGIGTCYKALSFTPYKMPDSVSIRPVHSSTSVLEDKEYQIECEIINIAPVQNLSVWWYRGNEAIEPAVRGPLRLTGCLYENNTHCDMSVISTPVNVSSTISITLGRKHSVAEFRCEACLDLGVPLNMTSSPLNVTVYYKPTINTTKLPKTVPVFRGYPEELVCEADGYPPPKIQWFFGSDKGAYVNGDILIVTQAGHYNCCATNDIDSISHEVEVILKEDYLPLIAGLVALTVVVISIIFVFIYSIYYKNTKMRRYSVKNPKLKNQNGNVAHNSWDMQFPMTKLSYVVVCTGDHLSASCPVELIPPSVVVEYGDAISINCSSLATVMDGMGWESPFGGTGLLEQTSVSWYVMSLQTWKIEPKCFINLPDDQCFKVAPITIYKMPEDVSVTVLHDGPLMENKMYVVLCTVTDVAPLRNLSLTMHTGKEVMGLMVNDTGLPTPQNLTIPIQKHFSRHHNGTHITCQAKLNLAPPGADPLIMTSTPYELIVHYPPTFIKPKTEMVPLPNRGEITLNCMATGNPVPVYSWQVPHYADENPGNQPTLTGSVLLPGTYNCTATNLLGSTTKHFIIAEEPRNRTTLAVLVGVLASLGVLFFIFGVIFVTRDGMFSFSKGPCTKGQPAPSGEYWSWILDQLQEESCSLQSRQAWTSWVFFPPSLTRHLACKSNMGNNFREWALVLCMIYSVSGDGCCLLIKPSRVVVGFGEPVSVTCEAARPVRVLGWDSSIGASHTQQDLSVQWKVDSLIDWIEEPICYGVFFTAPRQCEEKLNLVLYKTPDSISIRSANHTGPMVEGKAYQLLCEVQNIAPVQYLTLRWYRGHTEVYNHSFSDLTPSSPVQVSSILLVTPTRADNGAQYRCVAELELGPEGPQPPPAVTSELLHVSVYYPPTFLNPEPELVDHIMGAEITLNCTASGNPTPVYSWQSPHPTQEKVVDEAVLTSSSLLPGTYTCTASNALEKKSKQFIVKAKTKGV